MFSLEREEFRPNLNLESYGFEYWVGRYRNITTGEWLYEPKIISLVDQEWRRLEGELGDILGELRRTQNLQEFQLAASQATRDSVLRSTALGGGGVEQLTERDYQVAQALVRQSQDSIAGLGEQIATGKVTLGQAGAKTAALARYSRQAYYQANLRQRVEAGALEAKRTLAGGAKHCPSCPGHATNGFVPIDEVMPIGSACECGGRCRCRITYRKARLPNQNLIEAVTQNQLAVNNQRY